jgi:hypothetical protein
MLRKPYIGLNQLLAAEFQIFSTAFGCNNFKKNYVE